MAFEFDALKSQYASRRSVVYSTRGMCATSQPLSAQAGLDILKKGGNAIDAAIAVAACQTVLEPTSNGIGGDGFALIWFEGKLYGLNASGPAPMLLDVEELKKRGYDAMPKLGWGAVTVPGIVSGWAEMSRRFGKLSLTEVLEPAIRYAEEGYPVSPIISRLWEKGLATFEKETRGKGAEYDGWFDIFAPNGAAPRAGELVKLPHHAETLREIAATGGESFYRGAIADRIDAFSRATGGWLRKSDLAAYRAEWVEPISTDYKGYTVSEIPPNGHGIVALMALNILEQMELKGGHDDIDTIHKQLEAMKLAFVDGQHYVTDPRFMRVTAEEMLSKEYAAKRRALIGEKALKPEHGDPASGGTIYLCTADGDGNMVSHIQSNYCGFGSGITMPESGVSFHNRGWNFNMDPESENCVAPGKKPYHTIIPGFLSKDGKPVGPFGVMGGFMQPQGHVQVVMNTVDFGMNPQEALDAPRWQWQGGMNVELERSVPYHVAEALGRKGHAITTPADSLLFGRGQIIWRDENGVLCGASEPRADGFVAAW